MPAAVIWNALGCTVVPELHEVVVERTPDAGQSQQDRASKTETADESVRAEPTQSASAATPPAAGVMNERPASMGGVAGTAAASGASGANAGAGAESPGTQPLGATCAAGSECASMFCVDARCCDRASCGTCEACGSSGRCTPVRGAYDDDSCPWPKECSAAGKCGDQTGYGCTDASSCSSGFCSDGRCCDRSCGVCETCAADESPGRCIPIEGDSDPGECAEGRSCSISGSCLDIDQQTTLPTRGGWTFSGAFAQVITFGSAGRLEEIRFSPYCGNSRLPGVWLETTTDSGEPSGTRVSNGSLVEQPGGTDWSHTFKLSAPAAVRAQDELALVLQAPAADAGCSVVTSQDRYSRGRLYSRPPQGAWTLEDGAIKFLALVSR